MILLFPGQVGPRVSLQQCLRDKHAADRSFIDRELAARAARGVPADGLVALGDYVPIDGIDDVHVRFGVLAEGERRRLLAEHDAHVRRGEEAHEDAVASRAAFCAASVLSVEGITGPTGDAIDVDLGDMQHVQALRREGLLDVLFVCARHFQALPSGGALRFGLPPAST